MLKNASECDEALLNMKKNTNNNDVVCCDLKIDSNDACARMLIVTKFGGTSLATAERVINVAKRLVSYQVRGYQVVAVVSAMGKSTDDLLALARSVNHDPPARELDQLLATGEQVSMSVVAMAIEALGHRAVSMTGRQAGILTTTVHNKARIAQINTERVRHELDCGRIVIVAGFQGITEDGDITTLGRGGSDTSAVALAAALDAYVCEIYSDVDGVYTADPRVVPRAQKLPSISFEEMLELSAAGAGVLQVRAVEFARKFDVTLHCRSAFCDNHGTLVQEKAMENAIVSGIAYDNSEAKVTIRGVPDSQGIAAEVFSVIANSHINIDMIVQNVSENGITDISFTTPVGECAKLRRILEPVVVKIGAREIVIDEHVSKISLVGAGMRTTPGIAAKMFKVLADGGINILMISTSAIRVSVVISEQATTDALTALHTAFGLNAKEMFEETALSAEELAAKAAKGR
ncbi:MAG: aspartate kinase [Coriobacteriales bacterium]|jgi:aspartate kinase|nr:aspartate kinase [Coriobacteriales bacterium]